MSIIKYIINYFKKRIDERLKESKQWQKPVILNDKISGKRQLIVHFHLFKNAGSTIDHILKRNFSEQFYQYDHPLPWHNFSPEEVMQFIFYNKGLKVLSSHQMIYPLPKNDGLTIYSIIILRHPIDRIGSIYRFEKTNQQSSPSSMMAKRLDFKGYVLWQFGRKQRALKNYHIKRLSYHNDLDGYKNIRITEKEELNIAKYRLEQSGYYGLVERFDDSLILMKDYLQEGFPGLDYSYVVHNKTAMVNDLNDRIKQIKEQLGDELYAELSERNRFDLELYEYACNLFTQRMKKIEK